MKKYIISLATILSLSLVLFSCEKKQPEPKPNPNPNQEDKKDPNKEKKPEHTYTITFDATKAKIIGDAVSYTIKDETGAEAKDIDIAFEVKGKGDLSAVKSEALIAVDKKKNQFYPCYAGEMQVVATLNKKDVQKPIDLQIESKSLSPENFQTENGIYHLTEKEFIENVFDFKTTPTFPIIKVERPIVIKFGAVWCGPCKEEKPVLEELAKTYEDKVYIFDIDCNKDPYYQKLYTLLFKIRDDYKHFESGNIPYTVMIAPGTLYTYSLMGFSPSLKENITLFIEQNQLKK